MATAVMTKKYIPLLGLSHTVMKHSMSEPDIFPIALLILIGKEWRRSRHVPDKTRCDLLRMIITRASQKSREAQTTSILKGPNHNKKIKIHEMK
jgi:hypothetical protein